MKSITILILAISMMSCSTGKQDTVLYKTSVSTPSLEIPPDLTGLDDSKNKMLPSSKLGTKSAVSRYKDTGPLLDKVLPSITGVALKGEGGIHWLEVKQQPTELYNLVKAFWADEGFVLDQDEPLIGIMKTEWLENKASLLFSSESILSRFFSLFESTDTEDQYKVRIERGDDNRVSNVYLTQYGREFILRVDELEVGNESGWQSRVSDPELEVEMLSRLMLFLGLQDEEIKLQLAKIGSFPKRAQLIKSESGITTLVVKESFDRGWNRVLIQLDRLGVDYVSKEKNDSLIQIKQKSDEIKEEKGFFASLFSDSESKAQDADIVINLEFGETSEYATTVNIINSSGASDNSEKAVALLQYLFENLK